jgi:hypothetical protein
VIVYRIYQVVSLLVAVLNEVVPKHTGLHPISLSYHTLDPSSLHHPDLGLGRTTHPPIMETSSSSLTLVSLKKGPSTSLIPPRWDDDVRILQSSDCRAAGLSLAHAFAADDLAQYLVNPADMSAAPAEDKWKLHVNLMTYIVAATCYNGIATTIGPDYEGVALW